MPDPTYIALSNRHTLITRREKRFETCRIKQLLHSFNRMEEKTRGSNCWGHIFFFFFFFLLWAAFFFMFSKVDLTGTLSWLTDKTQQFSFISCWRLMSHKTSPPLRNQKHPSPNLDPQSQVDLGSSVYLFMVKGPEKCACEIIFFQGVCFCETLSSISPTDRFPGLFPFSK